MILTTYASKGYIIGCLYPPLLLGEVSPPKTCTKVLSNGVYFCGMLVTPNKRGGSTMASPVINHQDPVSSCDRLGGVFQFRRTQQEGRIQTSNDKPGLSRKRPPRPHPKQRARSACPCGVFSHFDFPHGNPAALRFAVLLAGTPHPRQLSILPIFRPRIAKY